MRGQHRPRAPSDSTTEICLDASRTKEQIRIAASTFCGRRAMVNKLWFREVVRKWFQTKHEPPQARCFTEPKCQDRLRAWYLLYRWLIFALWLSIVLCSVLEIGSVQVLGFREKWLIYLTNWDLSLGLAQSLLGAILVTRRWQRQKRPDFDPAADLAYGRPKLLYWILYVVTSSLALGVTVTYWSLVHDPRVHHVDVLNVLIHVSNSLLMLLDFCVAGVPFEPRCFWWCPLLVLGYLLFSLVYYAAGGLDKRGQRCIYDVLDWERPGRTLLVCAGGLLFLVLLHCALCFLAGVRDRAYARRRGPEQAGTGAGDDDAFRRKSESIV